jgi:hypothetical protein
MKRGPSKKALDAATEIIKKIDHEGKFVPGALYELTGKKLREYLAYAYEVGSGTLKG